MCGDDALPVTKTGFEDFVFRGRKLLPAFAGQTVDIATVVCKLENKKPKEIVRIYCERFRVRSDGSIDQEYRQRRTRGGSGNTGSRPGTINTSRPGTINTPRPATVNSRPPTIDETRAQRVARSLGMISRAAQKKILDGLWR